MLKKTDQVQTNDKEVTDLKAQIADLNNKWKRALADYQNLEKRMLGQREESAKYAAEKIIHALLVVYDTLEKAEKHIKDQGLTLGVNGFGIVLKANGLQKIEVIGKKFNPVEMEAIEVVEGNEDDIVIEELRSGYKLADKIIRVAQVKVSKKKIIN